MLDAQVRTNQWQQERAPKKDKLWPRTGAMFGLAFVLLQSVALGFMSSGGWPDPGAAKTDIVKTFTGGASSQLWIGEYLSILAALCFIPFVSLIASSYHAERSASGWLSTLALAGGWLLVAVEMSGAGALGALLTRAGHNLSASEALTLFDLAQALLFLFWTGATVFLIAAAALSLKLRLFPRWLGATAAVIAAAFVVAAPVSTQLLHIPATLFYLWVFAASIVLLRRPQALESDSRENSDAASIAR